MTKSQLCVKQICLPSIISVLTNNKKELWKTVSLTSFQKPPNAIRFNLLLQVYPSVLPSIFAVIYTSFCLYFEWLFLCCSQFGGSSLCLNSWHGSFESSYMFKSPSTPHVSVCVWKWRFFSLWFGLSSTRVGENGQRKRIFSNHSPEPKFSKPFAGLVWMQEKRIRRGVGSTILPRARDETKCPCSNQRRYRFQSLLHFRLDGKKTIQKRNVRRKAEVKISTFKQKRIRVNGD